MSSTLVDVPCSLRSVGGDGGVVETHGTPLCLRPAPALVGEHLVLPLAVPLAADLPDDFDAPAVLPGATSHFCSDRVMPRRQRDDHFGPTTSSFWQCCPWKTAARRCSSVWRWDCLTSGVPGWKSHMRILKCKVKVRSAQVGAQFTILADLSSEKPSQLRW